MNSNRKSLHSSHILLNTLARLMHKSNWLDIADNYLLSLKLKQTYNLYYMIPFYHAHLLHFHHEKNYTHSLNERYLCRRVLSKHYYFHNYFGFHY